MITFKNSILILLLAFTGIDGKTFRIGWLATTCLTFNAAGTHDAGRTDPGMGKRYGERINIIGSTNNNTTDMQTAASLAEYLDKSWYIALAKIRKEGLLSGHEIL